MSFYPATTQIDFYIQADTLEDAQQKLDNIIEQKAFRHETFEFPEIEQPQYNNSCVLVLTDSPTSIATSYNRDKILADIAISIGHEHLKDKYEFDSVMLVQEIICWVNEFIKIHQYTDWYENDYIITIDDFANQKIKQFINQLKS